MKKTGLRALAAMSAFAVLVGIVVSTEPPTPAVAHTDSVANDESPAAVEVTDTDTPADVDTTAETQPPMAAETSADTAVGVDEAHAQASSDSAAEGAGDTLSRVGDASGISPLSVPVGDHWMPDPGRAYVAFEVKDTAGDHVGGATVHFQGPRQTTGFLGTTVNWGSARQVVDCTTGAEPCPSNSLDQDSRPGHFAVDRLTAGTGTSIQSGSRYRIGASSSAPAGYNWATSALTGTNENAATTSTVTGATAGTGNSASGGQWNGTTNSVNVLTGPTLRSNALLCSVGHVFAIGANGQMQLIDPDGVVSSVGTATAGANMNGLGVARDGTAYATSRSGSSGSSISGTVYRYNPTNGNWARISNTTDIAALSNLVGGAVDPDGVYWAGGFNGDGDFPLWKLNSAGNGMLRAGTLDLPVSGAGNGDITFDSVGNLYLVRNVNSQVTIYRANKADLDAASGTGLIPVTQFYNNNNLTADVNGITYDASGRLYLGTGSTLRWLDIANPTVINTVTLTGTMSSTDLASCSYPPTVKLQKRLPDGRMVSGDTFGLTLRQGGTVVGGVVSGGTVIGSATASSPATGLQGQVAGPVPITSGTTVTFAETFTGGASAADYSSGWECTVEGAADPLMVGSGTAGSLVIPAMDEGKEITCEFVNTLLKVTKTAEPESGAAVSENDIIEYTLTFDNSEGRGPATVNYRDFLADVLDDAFFVDGAGNEATPQAPVVTTTGGITYQQSTDWNAGSQWINVRGTVPAGEIGTLKFPVKLHPNTYEAEERQESTATQGYFLRNKLVRGTPDTPPISCDSSLCTEHPVNAWTTYKRSLPVDGARLHKGGNAHYRLVAEKISPLTPVENLVFTDDLTAVFMAAGFAPDAAVPGGALKRGIYFFDATGHTLDSSGAINGTLVSPLPAYDEDSGYVPEPEPVGDRWILESQAVNMPTNAERAELWFAVQAAESPAGIPEAWPGAAPANAPKTGDKFTNYMTATADLAPVQCDTHTTPQANAVRNVADADFPAECQVTHELQDNYFTIRKDAQGGAVDRVNLPVDADYGSDPTGMWNMVGHEFEIRDNNGGQPTSHPSVNLCRVEYNPLTNGWNGDFDVTEGTPDWQQGSPTLQAIIEYNNDQLDEDDKLPLCALLYPQGTFGGQPNAGGQDGRWRSENLPAGDYWLVETKAPTHQVSLDGLDTRPVPGVQLLSEPIAFTVWQDEPDPNPNGQSHQGLGQLDVADGSSWLQRCEPGANVSQRPTACVNPTGYLMLVKDAAPTPLPLTGGKWLGTLTTGGLIVLIGAAVGAAWWRRKQITSAEKS